MVCTQVQLDERQARGLKKVARRHGVSQAEIAQRAVDALIAAEAGPRVAQMRARAISAIGCGRSGLADVSARHDDYLAEAYRL